MFSTIGLTIKITKILYSKKRKRIIMTLLIVGLRMDLTMREIVLQSITDKRINSLKDQDIIRITMRIILHLILSQKKIMST